MNKIEEQIKQVDWNNYDNIINFYESNRLYYENFEFIEDEDKISDFIGIKLHYANALFNKSRYDKVLVILDDVSKLLNKLGEGNWNYSKSKQNMMFLKGMVYGHKKKYKIAFPIFKQLTKEDPEHYYYKLWYNHSRLGLYNWLFNTLVSAGVAMVFIDIIFSLEDKIGFDIGIYGLAFAGLIYLIQKGLEWYYKREKTAHNTGS